jgi:exonuclease SbcC
LTLELTDVQSQIQSLHDQITPLQNLLESSELALSAHLQILTSLKDQRKAYFEGKSVEVLRKENQIQLEKLQSQAQKSLQKMNENKEFLAGIVAQIEQVEQSLVEQNQRKFEFKLILGLPSEDLVDLQDWITKNWLLWNEELQKSVDREAQIRAELNQNQLQTLEAQNLQKDVEAQSKIVFRWNLLNNEIGKADGSAFKEIAQAFTLEILLEHANSQLKQMTNRYTLKQINESLMFGVIDRDFYDEERPVHTLSGGETFIVSLALALGLSAMTSAGLSIESLFIDEGFGTLDSETLKSVMMALSSLHSQGRKVGLITHVEEMKEQIPVSIVVQKVGQGKSRVEVIGS